MKTSWSSDGLALNVPDEGYTICNILINNSSVSNEIIVYQYISYNSINI